MHTNNQQPCRSPQALHESSHSVDQWVNQLIESFEHRFDDSNVTLELDLQSFDAVMDPRLIHIAVSGLLENAMDAMPGGGEICVTLLNADCHWELEIADNAQGAFGASVPQQQPAPVVQEGIDELPIVIPFPANDHLRAAHRAAMLHGGQLQSFDCPQGGTAYVLVIPQRHPSRRFGNQ